MYIYVIGGADPYIYTRLVIVSLNVVFYSYYSILAEILMTSLEPACNHSRDDGNLFLVVRAKITPPTGYLLYIYIYIYQTKHLILVGTKPCLMYITMVFFWTRVKLWTTKTPNHTGTMKYLTPSIVWTREGKACKKTQRDIE